MSKNVPKKTSSWAVCQSFSSNSLELVKLTSFKPSKSTGILRL